jgi:ABC-type bacteriocin/lantibiotic exporter with double-glycine peptidase domain
MAAFEVSGMTLIPQQKTMSCWYASAQMLVKWKMDKEKMSLANLVPPDLDAQCRKIRDANNGLVNADMLATAKRLGLKAVPPQSPSPKAIQQWLQQFGPLWVNGKDHIVVIAGIRDLDVKVYDPWPVNKGKIDWRSLKDWYVGGTNPSGQPNSSRDTASDVTTVLMHC